MLSPHIYEGAEEENGGKKGKNVGMRGEEKVVI